MADYRTPVQEQADEGLTQAIRNVIEAYGGREYGMLTDFVAVYAIQDGEGYTAVGLHPRNGDQPLHRSLGLVDYAHARLHSKVMEE